MTDLKELIEQELDQYLEWPTADKSHVTTVSAKLFAEHVAQMYADYFRDAGKVDAPDVQGAPVATIHVDGSFVHVEWHVRAPLRCSMGVYAAPQHQPEESLSAADYEEVLADHRRLARELDVLLNGEEGAAKQASLCDLLGQLRSVVGRTGKPVLTSPDISALVEALEMMLQMVDLGGFGKDAAMDTARAALAAHRKQGGEA